MNSYWKLKKEMAKGSEPLYITKLFNELSSISCGLSLNGAGGGGFATIIVKKHITYNYLFEKINEIKGKYMDLKDITLHTVNIDHEGITSQAIEYNENNNNNNINNNIENILELF